MSNYALIQSHKVKIHSEILASNALVQSHRINVCNNALERCSDTVPYSKDTEQISRLKSHKVNIIRLILHLKINVEK